MTGPTSPELYSRYTLWELQYWSKDNLSTMDIIKIELFLNYQMGKRWLCQITRWAWRGKKVLLPTGYDVIVISLLWGV